MSPGSWLDTLPQIQKARHDFNTLKSEHCMQTKLLSVTPPWLQIPPWLQNMSPSCGEVLLFWHSFISPQNNPKFMLQMVSPTLKQWSVEWQQHYTDCQGIVHCRTMHRKGQTNQKGTNSSWNNRHCGLFNIHLEQSSSAFTLHLEGRIHNLKMEAESIWDSRKNDIFQNYM